MVKTFIISIRELMGWVVYPLQAHVEESKIEAIPLIDVLLAEYCSKEVTEDTHLVRRMLQELEIDPELAAVVAEDLRVAFTLQMIRTIGPTQEDVDLTYTISTSGDVYITQRPSLPPRTPSLIDQLAEEVAKGIDEGDWFSERIRRTVGA